MDGNTNMLDFFPELVPNNQNNMSAFVEQMLSSEEYLSSPFSDCSSDSQTTSHTDSDWLDAALFVETPVKLENSLEERPKKRKRVGNDELNWDEKKYNITVYSPDENRSLQPLTIRFFPQLSGQRLAYCEEEDSHIHFKRNQFHLSYTFSALLPNNKVPDQFYLLDSSKQLVQINSFMVASNGIAVKNISREERVLQLQLKVKSKSKQEMKNVSPIQILPNNSNSHDRLYFSESTNRRPGVEEKEFFHLVASLVAVDVNGVSHPITKWVSGSIVVRSGHPASYIPKSQSQSQSQQGFLLQDQPPIQMNPVLPFSTPDISNAFMSDNIGINNNIDDSHNNNQYDISIPVVNPSGWFTNEKGDLVIQNQKVGINTLNPQAALSVCGDAQVTGNVYRPSDRRIKSDITEVESDFQLNNLRNIKIYDYQKKDPGTGEIYPERGVIAQELKEVLGDDAVKQIQMQAADGKFYTDFLVVNDRALLMETVGATKAIDKNVTELGDRVKNIEEYGDDISQFQEEIIREHKRRCAPNLMFACSAIILLISVIILALIVLFFVFGPHNQHDQNPPQQYNSPQPGSPPPMQSPQPHQSGTPPPHQSPDPPRYPNIDYPQGTPTQNECAAGQYFDPYASSCDECPDGFVNPQPGSLYCYQCKCGSTAAPDHVACINCNGSPCITFCPE